MLFYKYTHCFVLHWKLQKTEAQIYTLFCTVPEVTEDFCTNIHIVLYCTGSYRRFWHKYTHCFVLHWKLQKTEAQIYTLFCTVPEVTEDFGTNIHIVLYCTGSYRRFWHKYTHCFVLHWKLQKTEAQIYTLFCTVPEVTEDFGTNIHIVLYCTESYRRFWHKYTHCFVRYWKVRRFWHYLHL